MAHKLDPYKPIIDARLEEFPKLSARRLFDEVRAAGYPGCYENVRNYVRVARPREPAEPVVRFETPPARLVAGRCGGLLTHSSTESNTPAPRLGAPAHAKTVGFSFAIDTRTFSWFDQAVKPSLVAPEVFPVLEHLARGAGVAAGRVGAPMPERVAVPPAPAEPDWREQSP